MFLLFLKGAIFFAIHIPRTSSKKKQQEDKPYFWIKDEFMKHAKQQRQNH